jgi:hypothetical protein
LQQPGYDQLAIEHVHLAADGFDIELFGHAVVAMLEVRGRKSECSGRLLTSDL